jgi:8-oxo-dGTP pyrophosphatase MutT (NUDIX family)
MPNTPEKKPYTGAGIILARLNDGEEPRFLLLRGRKTGVWSFAKGRPEENDRGTPLRTAVRETYEETGFMAGKEYTLMNKSIRFGKRAYWLGVMEPNATQSLSGSSATTATPSPKLRIRSAEHTMAGWFTWDEVDRLQGNTDVREWTKKSRKAHGSFLALINTWFASTTPATCLTAGGCNES